MRAGLALLAAAGLCAAFGIGGVYVLNTTGISDKVLLEDAGATTTRELYQGKPIGWWARRTVQARKDANARGRTIRRLKLELRLRWAPTAGRAAEVACAAYAHHGGCSPSLIYAQIRCETGGTFSPFAKNRRSTASGWGQWLDTTWSGTPFARFSRFDPMANVLAMAKAHADGNGESTRGPWAASAGCWS